MKPLLLTLSICCVPLLMMAQFFQISSRAALEDLAFFEDKLIKESSYYRCSDEDVVKDLAMLKQTMAQQDSIDVMALSLALTDILSKIGDRHSKAKFEDWDNDDYPACDRYFPMALTRHEDQLIGLRLIRATRTYTPYNDRFPYIKSINGLSVRDFGQKYLPRHQKAPDPAYLVRLSEDIRDMGELYFMHGIDRNDVDLVMTDGHRDTSLRLPLVEKRQWHVPLPNPKYKYRDQIKEEDFSFAHQLLRDSIAYFILNDMYGRSEMPSYFEVIEQGIASSLGAKAWILDVRYNGGGVRDLLDLFAAYLVQPEQSPWVANVAYVRSDQYLDEDISSMDHKGLHSYDSEHFSEEDRRVIDDFMKTFEIERPFDASLFSQPYYSVLRSGPVRYTGPVYILANERSFSAATVFAALLKDLPNVYLVGEVTDGSSGRSRHFWLPNSNIHLKLSSMISLQRDGKTLDGNGTMPEIPLQIDMDDISRAGDSQLERLLDLILE